MNTCAIQISPRCNGINKESNGESTKEGTVLSRRGICSSCWKYLVEIEEIKVGVALPVWLTGRREGKKFIEAGLIQIQDAFDHYGDRKAGEKCLDEYLEEEKK